jgi:tetratricopeptide (TPR) repeat protein
MAVQAFNQGARHFNAREFSAAIPYFDQAIERDPQFAEAFYARGACRHYLKEPDAAVADLTQAIRLSPDYAEAYVIRGDIYYESGKWSRALSDFNRALKLQPDDAQSILARGVIYLKQQNLRAARSDFKKFLALKPHDPLVPRIRKLLASLPAEEGIGEPAPGGAPAAQPGPGYAYPPATAGAQRVSRNAMQLADDIMNSHNLEHAAGEQALNGERAQVSGDLPNQPSPNTEDNSDVQIITPPSK